MTPSKVVLVFFHWFCNFFRFVSFFLLHFSVLYPLLRNFPLSVKPWKPVPITSRPLMNWQIQSFSALLRVIVSVAPDAWSNSTSACSLSLTLYAYAGSKCTSAEPTTFARWRFCSLGDASTHFFFTNGTPNWWGSLICRNWCSFNFSDHGAPSVHVTHSQIYFTQPAPRKCFLDAMGTRGQHPKRKHTLREVMCFPDFCRCL